MKKLSIDNPFFECMGKLADIVLLNILFLISALPVVTIGGSVAALYQSFDDMAEGEFLSAFHNFKKAWKKHLKAGTKAWAAVLLSGCLLVFDLTFVGGMSGSVGGAWRIIGVGVGCLLVIWEMIFCYIFPVILKGETKVKEMIKKSLLLAIHNFQYTILMIVINSIPVVLFVLGGSLLAAVVPLYAAFGFALTVYVNTFS